MQGTKKAPTCCECRFDRGFLFFSIFSASNYRHWVAASLLFYVPFFAARFRACHVSCFQPFLERFSTLRASSCNNFIGSLFQLSEISRTFFTVSSVLVNNYRRTISANIFNRTLFNLASRFSGFHGGLERHWVEFRALGVTIRFEPVVPLVPVAADWDVWATVNEAAVLKAHNSKAISINR